MSVYEKILASFKSGNSQEYLDILHPDYVFVRHQSNEKVNKADWSKIVQGMYDAMNEGKLRFTDNRCIFENSEILVMHNIGHFPDGSKEAIMIVHSLDNGAIIKTESGATPIK